MRTVAIVLGILVLLAAVMTFNVWRASEETVTRTPGPLETGRMKLHAQLEEARKIEVQAETQNWDSAPRLRALMHGHEQRIEELKGNSEAAEILAYDRDAILRLEKRITELAEQEAAKEADREAARKADAATQADQKVVPKADAAKQAAPKWHQ